MPNPAKPLEMKRLQGNPGKRELPALSDTFELEVVMLPRIGSWGRLVRLCGIVCLVWVRRGCPGSLMLRR